MYTLSLLKRPESMVRRVERQGRIVVCSLEAMARAVRFKSLRY